MCYALTGIEGYAVDVETDISAGLTGMEIVGLAGTAVKEAKDNRQPCTCRHEKRRADF